MDYLKKDISIKEIKENRKKVINQLKRKENETKESHYNRMQAYYTSFLNTKKEFLIYKEAILRFNDFENEKDFKERIIVEKHELDIYPRQSNSLFDFLETELRNLLLLDLDGKLNFITYGYIRFNIKEDDHEEICLMIEKQKIEHYKKIEYIESELNKLKQYQTIDTNNTKETEENSHPHIFIETETYINFKTYTERHIIDKYIDYSYLFQKMKSIKLIHYIRHIDFIEWLFEYDYINEKDKKDFLIKNTFRSLEKSYSTQRENNFNNIFNP